MANWDVELSFGIGFTVNGIKANTKDEAIKKAVKLVTENTTILTGSQVVEGNLEYNHCTYSQKA